MLELKVNVNSYVSLDEADDFVEQNYSEKNNLACHWKVLSDSTKSIYLVKSARQIDSQMYAGRRLTRLQFMAFPRSEGWKHCTIPDEVKIAQIINALAIFNERLKKDSRIAKSGQPIAAENPIFEPTMGAEKLTSDEALTILRPWIF